MARLAALLFGGEDWAVLGPMLSTHSISEDSSQTCYSWIVHMCADLLQMLGGSMHACTDEPLTEGAIWRPNVAI